MAGSSIAPDAVVADVVTHAPRRRACYPDSSPLSRSRLGQRSSSETTALSGTKLLHWKQQLITLAALRHGSDLKVRSSAPEQEQHHDDDQDN